MLSGELQRFALQDLVLRVGSNVDRNRWDEDRYEPFLEALCGYREYQKEALRTVLRYLLGGQYSSLRDLARENWDRNPALREKHGTWARFERQLQLPDMLSATIDLATATGKSYVMYGLALILMAEGVVDRVLVLCPSTTIEDGLFSKFERLARSPDLRDALPPEARIRTPKIIRGDESIVPGSICVENREAVYERVRSSISDSLSGKGHHVAVINDEVHHVVNAPDGATKKWKEFLLEPRYGFRIVVGFSGTCYVGDEYFSDVIYRYSMRQAMEENFVKKVRYVTDTQTTGEEDENWQLWTNQHERIRSALASRGIRPLTIIVTRDIKMCQQVGDELRRFLVDRRGYSETQARDMVLVVYNNAPDVRKLATVDDKASPVEWIVSVSMLNEGWDVKRVFQIIPHHKRAFDSKLLIAQVLGRGLRKPDGWEGPQPEVTVFNHAAWADSIRHLVNEVMEDEKRLTCRVIPESPYHFELHTFDYEVLKRVEEREPQGPIPLLDIDGCIPLPSEGAEVPVSVEFERMGSGQKERWETVISRRTYTPEEVAAKLWNILVQVDQENAVLLGEEQRTRYSEEYPFERLKEIVTRSLQRIGSDVCTESNLQRFQAYLSRIRPRAQLVARYDLNPNGFRILSTVDRPNDYVTATQLKRDKAVFWHDGTRPTLPDNEIAFFDEVTEPASGYKVTPIPNMNDFRSPVNFVIADSDNERRFVWELLRPENSKSLTAWIKSTAMNFYGIRYAWYKGRYPKYATFNPDFFLKVDNTILVIEIKDVSELDDPSPENLGKYEYATAHFRKVEEELSKQGIDLKYRCHFLTKNDFPEFFQRLREGKYLEYGSQLDWKLATKLQGGV